MRRVGLIAAGACALAAMVLDGACSNDAARPDGGGDAAPDGAVAASYDVVVVGATASGIAAAVEAARLGVKVALLEETDIIGGQFATQAVGRSDDDGYNSESGVYGELRRAATAYYAAIGKTFIGGIEPHVAQILFGQMLQTAGVTVLLRTRVDSVDSINTSGTPTVTGVHVTEHGVGALAFAAKIVVDATDTGDVLALSPARYRAGNTTSDALDTSACVLDMTYAAVIKQYPGGAPPELLVTTPPPGYDPTLFANAMAAEGWTFPVFVSYRALPDSSSSLDYDGGPDFSKFTKTVVNFYNDYPMAVSDLDRSARKHAYCEAKLRTLQALYYINTETGHTDWAIANDEGYDSPYNLEENLCVEIPDAYKTVEKYFPPTPYVRESRRMVGLSTLTASQAARVGVPPVAAQEFPSALSVNDYCFDFHGCYLAANLESGLESFADIPESHTDAGLKYSCGQAGPFQIPFEAFIPEKVDGLLAAEKNISVSRLVNGGTRLHPAVMHNGMAVGVLAALAIERGVQPRQVPSIVAQNHLVTDTSMVALQVFADVPREAGVGWGDVQIAAVLEIMNGTGGGQFGYASPTTRAQSAVVLKKTFNLPDFNPAQPTFADVPFGDPFYAFVESMFQAGLTAGCGAGADGGLLFCPTDPVTRAQMAVFVVKAMGLDPKTASSTPLFDDVSADGGASAEFAFIQLVGQNDLLDACGPKLFCPTAPLKRGEAAQIVRRSLVHLAK